MVRHRAIAAALALLAAVVAAPALAQQSSVPAAPASASKEAGAIRRADRTKVVSTPYRSVGQRSNLAGLYVWGGRPVQYRYVVGIAYAGANGHAICTGTLVGPRLVLTAGHCACGTGYQVTQSLEMKDGPHLDVEDRPILFDRTACQWPGQISPGRDLALLRLSRDASVDASYNAFPPLAYDNIERTRVGSSLVVIGYGLTETRSQGVRLEAAVPVYSPDCARRQMVEAGCAPFFEMILASRGGGAGPQKDTCSGDSGGPVFVMGVGLNGGDVPILVGVTSRPAPLPQVDTENHCGGGGIYTVVGRTDVRQWLRQNGVVDLSQR
jgi:hypothetical protein